MVDRQDVTPEPSSGLLQSWFLDWSGRDQQLRPAGKTAGKPDGDAAACKRTVAEALFGLPILLQRVLCTREEARQQGNLLRRGTEIDGESKSACKPAKIGRGVKWGCERIGAFVPMRNAIAFRFVVDYRAATCTPSGTS